MSGNTLNASNAKKGNLERAKRLREERKQAMLPLGTTKVYDNGGMIRGSRKAWTHGGKVFKAYKKRPEGLQRPIAGASTSAFLATHNTYRRDNIPFVDAPVSNIAIGDKSSIVDFQLGFQPNHKSYPHKASSCHDAALNNPYRLRPSSTVQGTSSAIPSSAMSSRFKLNVDSFCYNHTSIIPIDIYFPPAAPNPPPHPSLSRAQRNDQFVGRSNIFPNFGIDSPPGQYNAPGFDNAYSTPPISCDGISHEDFSHVMAAMVDPSHPSSIAAARSSYYYWPEKHPAWFEECAYCRQAGYSCRG